MPAAFGRRNDSALNFRVLMDTSLRPLNFRVSAAARSAQLRRQTHAPSAASVSGPTVFVWRKWLRFRVEPREVAAEEVRSVPFKSRREFTQPLKLIMPSSPRVFRALVHRHEKDLGQLPAVVLQRHACRRSIPLASDDDEAVPRAEPAAMNSECDGGLLTATHEIPVHGR